jgi:Kdo2-lipid IVA lauroyltransferase/acyltransferase
MQRQLSYLLFLDYSLYLLVRVIETILNILPDKAAVAFGKFLGRLVFVLVPDRRRAAEENLTIAFGSERSAEWIDRTCRLSFEHLGLVVVEFFRIRHWNQEKLAEKIVIEGRLPFNLAMAPGREGICLLNSHFGYFEVSAATIKHLGVKLNVIVTGLKNPFLSRYFFSRGGRSGEDTGIKTYPHKGIVKEMIELLKKGEMVAFLADQRGDAERGVFVDFFGSKAAANEVFARLAIDGQARVLPLCTYRRDDGRYQSVFGEEIVIKSTGDPRRDLEQVSQQFHDLFEKWLRMVPEQGFWVQRKWRRKPSKKHHRSKSH